MIEDNAYTLKELYSKVVMSLEPVWKEEAQVLTKYLFKEVLHCSWTDIVVSSGTAIDQEAKLQLENIISRLLQMEPVQYILGYTYFLERKFLVSPDVLIPRPETEELVMTILEHVKFDKPSILDIGTGSGCIGITLALETGTKAYTGIDISKAALALAEENARRMGVGINCVKMDILRDDFHDVRHDLIVSNPPYVRVSEKKHMKRNVLEYEPEMALFVPETDPLVFYRRIAGIAADKLSPGGMLFFEINEAFGTQIGQLLRESGFGKVFVKQDLNGKDRFVYGRR